jgi:hypothetical protein
MTIIAIILSYFGRQPYGFGTKNPRNFARASVFSHPCARATKFRLIFVPVFAPDAKQARQKRAVA